MTTNYERIAGTPEKLAEFMGEITERCTMGDSACKGCLLGKCCYSKEKMLEWLQEQAK